MAGLSVRTGDFEARAREAERLRPLTGPGAILLETCHRVELYSVAEIAGEVATGDDAFRHLARVAAGLESAAPGEGEVLHQVREALGQALAAGPVDPELARAFELAIAAGRRARAGLVEPPSGLAEQAVRWLVERVPDVRDGATAVVAGRGRMGRRVAALLAEAGAVVVTATRTPVPGTVSLAEGAGLTSRAAAVAVALAGPWNDLTDAPAGHVVDLSWPPALPAPVRSTLGARLLEIDAVAGPAAPGEWTARATAAVDEAAVDFAAWQNSRSAAPLISALLERTEARRHRRVRRALQRLGEVDDRQAAVIEQLSRQLVADVLHEPLAALREGRGENAVKGAFGL